MNLEQTNGPVAWVARQELSRVIGEQAEQLAACSYQSLDALVARLQENVDTLAAWSTASQYY